MLLSEDDVYSVFGTQDSENEPECNGINYPSDYVWNLLCLI